MRQEVPTHVEDVQSLSSKSKLAENLLVNEQLAALLMVAQHLKPEQCLPGPSLLFVHGRLHYFCFCGRRGVNARVSNLNRTVWCVREVQWGRGLDKSDSS